MLGRREYLLLLQKVPKQKIHRSLCHPKITLGLSQNGPLSLSYCSDFKFICLAAKHHIASTSIAYEQWMLHNLENLKVFFRIQI